MDIVLLSWLFGMFDGAQTEGFFYRKLQPLSYETFPKKKCLKAKKHLS